MQDILIKHYYAQVNGSLVHLIHYESNEELRTDGSSSKKVLVFIPGNLGLIEINHDFIVHLFNNLKQSCETSMPSIIAIGHNNFEFPTNSQDIAGNNLVVIDESNMKLADLIKARDYENEPNHIELQVLNKLVILRHLFGKNFDRQEFIFVGHSVGCYILLKLLQDPALRAAHLGSVLIHPAIDDLCKTERGYYWARVFRYRIHLLFLLLMFIVENFLPESFKMFMVRSSCKDEFVDSSSKIVVDSALRMACYKTAQSTFEMVESSLAAIKSAQSMDMIQPLVDKLKFIYARDDYWVDPESIRLLRESYPRVYIEEHPVMHAFMMSAQTTKEHARRVAELVRNIMI